ncbi:MAG: hypothetical protein WC766_04090 [Patescibacteria group bacterium]|jgi:hypothetical protein
MQMLHKNKKNLPPNFSEVKAEMVKRDQQVEDSLRTIFQVQEDSPEGAADMAHLVIKKSYRWLWAAIGIPVGILVLCGAAWSGFLFFKSFDVFSGNGLVLSVEGPVQITLGEETTYFINYYNPLRSPISSVEVRANFPSDFVPTEFNPKPADQNMVWKIGDLAAEEKGIISVKGKFLGSLGALSAIQAVATYKPAGSSGNLEALATEQITFSGTVLEGEMVAPEKAVPGDEISFVYKIHNKGSDALDGLEARMTLPEGLTILETTSSGVSVDDRVFRKTLSTLAAGSSTVITVNGVFASGFGGQAKVSAQTGTVGADDVFKPMQTTEESFPVLAGDLSLKLFVNGSNAAERSVAYGNNLQFTLGYENTADEPLKNISLRLILETVNLDDSASVVPALIDWNKLGNAASSTQKDQTLVWDGSTLPALKEMAPRSDGSLDFSVPLSADAAGAGLSAVRATVFANIESIGGTKVNRTIQIVPMVFKLKTDAKLSAEARYFSDEGVPVGSGPLPPQVGQATHYRIFWNIDKRVHSLKDLSVKSVLPRNVDFVSLSTSTAGELTYDNNTRTVSWSLNRLPEEVQNAQVQFEVALTPISSDSGKFVDLAGDASFQVFDEVLKENISQTLKALNTDLQNDEGAVGKGVVRK